MKQLSLFDDLSDATPVRRAARRPSSAESAIAPATQAAVAVDLPAPAEPAPIEPVHPPHNLAELELLLRTSLPKDRKAADMRSALRTTAKVLGRAMDRISTEPAELNKLLSQASPLIGTVSPARWSRVKSLLLSALVAGGSDVLPGRDLQGFSPLWQELANRLPDKRSRIGLSRLLSYLSRAGVTPKDVVAGDLEAFGAALKTKSLRINPEQVYRTSLRLWNAATTLPGWPDVSVVVQADPRRYSLPWEDFPATFRQDTENFHANSGDPDPFSETYCRPVRPATVDARRKQIHQLASALVASGFPIQDIASLQVLTQPRNAEAALRYLLRRRGGKTGEHLEGQARLLRTIARHWVRDVEAADAIARMSKGLHVKKVGMTAKNRLLLKQFDLPKNVEALLGLPLRVFAEERRPKTPTPEQALRAERAFAVELLLVAPMRVRNLTEIEIGRHLMEVRRGKHKRYHIVFTPEETKTREPLEMELPQQTAVLLETYLERYRPVLCPAGSPYLFGGGRGESGERSSVAFSTALARFIKSETGLTMHAHLFRQFAGKFYLDHQPNDIETVRRILGHRSTATTLRSYAQLRVDHAFRSYDALVEAARTSHGLEKGARKPSRSRSAVTKKKLGSADDHYA